MNSKLKEIRERHETQTYWSAHDDRGALLAMVGDLQAKEYRKRIEELEADNEELLSGCDRRDTLIEQLQAALDEIAALCRFDVEVGAPHMDGKIELKPVARPKTGMYLVADQVYAILKKHGLEKKDD